MLTPTTKQRTQYKSTAITLYEDLTGDVEIDGALRPTEKGCWVSAWVYVSDNDLESTDKDK